MSRLDRNPLWMQTTFQKYLARIETARINTERRRSKSSNHKHSKKKEKGKYESSLCEDLKRKEKTHQPLFFPEWSKKNHRKSAEKKKKRLDESSGCKGASENFEILEILKV